MKKILVLLAMFGLLAGSAVFANEETNHDATPATDEAAPHGDHDKTTAKHGTHHDAAAKKAKHNKKGH